MYCAILAYHQPEAVKSLAPEEDAALMQDLYKVHQKLEGKLGPAARLDYVNGAVTLRGPGEGVVIDGPFAETKEHLLGLYVIEVASINEAVDAARDLRRANPSAVYEIRPITTYLPGAALPSLGV